MSPRTSVSKSKRERRRSRRGIARGTATPAGSAVPCARARPAAARREQPQGDCERAGILRCERRSTFGASGAGPSRKKRSPSSSRRSREPARPPPCPPVLREPPRELLGRLLGLELGELGLLVGEQRARLQLEQRGDEDEELAARLEVELLPLREPLEERHHDARRRRRRAGRAPP